MVEILSLKLSGHPRCEHFSICETGEHRQDSWCLTPGKDWPFNFFRRSDGRVVVTNTLHTKNQEEVDPCDRGKPLDGELLSTKVSAIRHSLNVRFDPANSKLRSLVELSHENEEVRITHIKVGTNPIIPFEGPEQLKNIFHGTFRYKTTSSFFLYEDKRKDQDEGYYYETAWKSHLNGLRKEDTIAETHVFDNPEWTLGMTQSHADRRGWPVALTFKLRSGSAIIYEKGSDSRPLGNGLDDGNKIHFVRLNDGRLIVTNDLWIEDDTCDGDLAGTILATSVSGCLDLSKFSLEEYLSRRINEENMHCLTHVKVGGKPIKAYREHNRPDKNTPGWLIYERVGSKIGGLREGDVIDGTYVYQNPEWTLGLTQSQARGAERLREERGARHGPLDRFFGQPPAQKKQKSSTEPAVATAQVAGGQQLDEHEFDDDAFDAELRNHSVVYPSRDSKSLHKRP